MFWVLIVFAITYHVTLQAIREGYPSRRGSILAMMVFVTLFAGKMVTYAPGIVSNFGDVWYAAALLMLAVGVEQDGRGPTTIIVVRTIYWLVLFVVTLWVLANSPAIGGDDALASALSVMSKEASRDAIWSWTAFAMASGTILVVMHVARRWPFWLRLFAALVAGQFVDSAIFFPGLVGLNEHGLQAAAVGLLVKSAATALLMTTLTVNKYAQR